MKLPEFIFKKRSGATLELDAKARILLFEKAVENFDTRLYLIRSFKPDVVSQAIEKWNLTKETLYAVDSLISAEFVNIDAEVKTGDEILHDLKSLMPEHQVRKLSEDIVTKKNDEEKIIQLMEQWFVILQSARRLIRALLKDQIDKDEGLRALFDLINTNEQCAIEIFRASIKDPVTYQRIRKLCEFVVLEKDLKLELHHNEEKFAAKMAATDKAVQKMASQMTQTETPARYSLLANDIFSKLAEEAGKKLTTEEDVVELVEHFQKTITDDMLLVSIVRKSRPRYDDAKVKVVIAAFRQAYDLGHFRDIEGDKFIDVVNRGY